MGAIFSERKRGVSRLFPLETAMRAWLWVLTLHPLTINLSGSILIFPSCGFGAGFGWRYRTGSLGSSVTLQPSGEEGACGVPDGTTATFPPPHGLFSYRQLSVVYSMPGTLLD